MDFYRKSKIDFLNHAKGSYCQNHMSSSKRKDKALPDIIPENTYQLLPPLAGVEYQDLKADVARRSVLVAVEMDENGQVLDGHHRLQICAELGIKDYPSIIRVGLSEAEKRSHIRALNLHRRHLSTAQRGALIEQQLKDTPRRSNLSIAKLLGVNDKTVAAVRDRLERRSEIPNVTIRIDAKGRAQPSRRAAVIAPDRSQARRAFDALTQYPGMLLPAKTISVKRLERISREQRVDERTPVAIDHHNLRNKEQIDIRCGTFTRALGDIADGSVHMVLTDPPYGRGFLPLWDELARFCARTLRPGGLLVSYCGQSHLPDVYAALNRELKYVWTIAQLARGPKIWFTPRASIAGGNPC